MHTLKEVIKEKAENQKFLKNQRKTVHFVGDRILPPSEAFYKHLTQRLDLRSLYIAYAIMREKDPKLAVGNYNPEQEGKYIQTLIEHYAPVCLGTE